MDFQYQLYLENLAENTPIHSIEIQPLKGYLQYGTDEIYFQECDESKAQLWSINIRLPDKGLICIADAASRESAETLVTLIKTIGKNLRFSI